MKELDLEQIKTAVKANPMMQRADATTLQQALDLIERAYFFAQDQHRHQQRESGEPYFNHLIATALFTCEMQLDPEAVAAALLHDTIEDCGVTPEELGSQFSPTIAAIVDGVSKFTQLEENSRSYKQAKNLKKMLIAAGTDMRVVMVKLCDRLHNMRTLDAVSPRQQRRKAAETRDFYVPLAHRLGLLTLRLELEDLSLRYLEPEVYSRINQNIKEQASAITKFANQGRDLLAKILSEARILAEVSVIRRNHYYIWRRMTEHNEPFTEVADLINFVIIVENEIDCYDTLGALHAKLRPLPLHFSDYIARPKSNMYQSLHTTVMDPSGNRMPIKIRTHDMDRVTYRGIIEYWYSQSDANRKEFNLSWMTNFLETQKFIENHEEFLESIRTELFPFEIVTLTPKGDPMVLPRNATPLDFAYSIDEELGHRTKGALVNGIEVPLNHTLNDGDTIELITSEEQHPLPQWLNYVKLAKTRQCIRKYLEEEEHRRQYTLGREIVSQQLRAAGKCIQQAESAQNFLDALRSLGYDSIRSFYCAVAQGRNLVNELLQLITTNPQSESAVAQLVNHSAADIGGLSSPFLTKSQAEYVLESAPCCDPLFGEDIRGVLTQSGRIMVHSADCPTLRGLPEDLILEVIWNSKYTTPKAVKMSICTVDRIGMLKEVVKTISELDVNIHQANIFTTSKGEGRFELDLFVNNAQQLVELTTQLSGTEGVIEVRRIVQTR